MINSQKKNRRTILIIFGMTILPFVVAVLIAKVYPSFSGGTNYGQLISPPVPTRDEDAKTNDFSGFDSFSSSNINELAGHWVLLTVIPGNQCNAVCLESIFKVRQLRLMLSRDFSRTRRAVLIFNEVADAQASQWWLKDSLLWRLPQTKNPADKILFTQLLAEENKLDETLVTRLIGTENRKTALQSDLIKLKPSDSLRKKIPLLLNAAPLDGMLLLIDPLGNIMMRYESGFDPYQVVKDLKKLLTVSQIG